MRCSVQECCLVPGGTRCSFSEVVLGALTRGLIAYLSTESLNCLSLRLLKSGDPFLFLVYFCLVFGCAAQHVRSQFSNWRSNPCPLHWKLGILTAGPPGKSPVTTFYPSACLNKKPEMNNLETLNQKITGFIGYQG